MKKKKIEIEINVPEPGDTLPFEVIRIDDMVIQYNGRGDLIVSGSGPSVYDPRDLASALFDIPDCILSKTVMDEAKGEVIA